MEKIELFNEYNKIDFSPKEYTFVVFVVCQPELLVLTENYSLTLCTSSHTEATVQSSAAPLISLSHHFKTHISTKESKRAILLSLEVANFSSYNCSEVT